MNLRTMPFFAAFFLLAGCLTDSGSTSSPQNPKRLFVTSSTHTGDLGGLAGADSICGARAAEAQLEGTWTAFLSDSLTRAADRVAEAETWFLVDGKTVVFRNNAEFSERPQSSIHDENGDPVPGGQAWTGTLASGDVHAGHHCANWTSSAQQNFGSAGEPVLVDSDNGPRWMHVPGTPRCASTGRIYCMEQ